MFVCFAWQVTAHSLAYSIHASTPKSLRVSLKWHRASFATTEGGSWNMGVLHADWLQSLGGKASQQVITGGALRVEEVHGSWLVTLDSSSSKQAQSFWLESRLADSHPVNKHLFEAAFQISCPGGWDFQPWLGFQDAHGQVYSQRCALLWLRTGSSWPEEVFHPHLGSKKNHITACSMLVMIPGPSIQHTA